jgi:microcystin-dependent protein
MTEPFVAEIRIFAGNFAPKGWAQCDGQLMPISQNTALFSLLGTNYGGDGKSTFGLPNLQGSAPLHAGSGPGPGLTQRFTGEIGGEPNVTLLTTEMPIHGHTPMADTTDIQAATPAGNAWAAPGAGRGLNIYDPAAGTSPQTMNPQALSITGSSFPHNNMPPYLGLTFIIALQGVFPARG